MPEVQKKERKTGFQVGPKHAGRDAYLGKAKKIKQDLIHRAKLKKTFAKTLKKEGLSSSRLTRDGGWGGMRQDHGKGKGRAVASADDESAAEAGEEVNPGQEGSKKEKTKMLSSLDPSLHPSASSSSRKDERQDRSKPYNPTSHPARSHRPPKPSIPSALNALTPSSPSPKSQSHPPRSAQPQASGARRPNAPSPHPTRESLSKPRTDPRLLKKNKKGQPSMGGRMEVLLEKIQAGRS